MVRHLVSWIQNPQSAMDTSTDPSRSVRQEAPMVSSEGPRHHFCWPLVFTAVLCCLLLIASIVLGILYDRESKKNYNPELDALLADYHNITALYKMASEANGQLRRENMNMSRTIDQWEKQNRNLTELNAQLQRDNQALSDANALLTGEVEREAENNTALLLENERLIDQNSRLQSENHNLTQQNIKLEREARNFSEANSFLKSCCENSTLLLMENQGLLEENAWLKHQNQTQSHQNAWLEMQALALMRDNARLRRENADLLDDKFRLYLNYQSLDQYCPVVNEETQERLCKKCDVNWIIFRSKCYLFSRDKKSWHDSQSHCQSEGGDLLIVNSEEEQKFAFRTSLSVNQEGTRIWIGLTDVQTEGEWLWVDGSPVLKDFQFWFHRADEPEEPDDWKVINSAGEDCGHLDISLHELKSWMDGPCETAYRSICEKSL